VAISFISINSNVKPRNEIRTMKLCLADSCTQFRETLIGTACFVQHTQLHLMYNYITATLRVSRWSCLSQAGVFENYWRCIRPVLFM